MSIILTNVSAKILIDSKIGSEILMIEKLKKSDTCLGIITKYKTSPFYYNKEGKYLIYMFCDENGFKPIKKNGGGKILNIEENKILW